jgi:hemolysin activation/secretion protein
MSIMPIFLLFTLFFPSLCVAELPDAGQILRQQEQNQPKFDRLPPPEILEPEVLAPPEKGVTIVVKSIVIRGGESLESNDVLQALVADSIGQSLDFSQLQKLAERISQHLKAKGWLLTKAYLPKQDVTEGNIQITITQGHLEIDEQGHSITIQRAPDTRLDDEVIQERMRYIISGDTLQGENLERTLLLLNDLTGVQAKTTLEKGKKAGTSRLGLNVKEGDLIKGTASIDDTGSHYTGTWVGNLNVNINDVLGQGEQFSFGNTSAENLMMGRASFSMPIGYDGLQVNTRYSYLDYSVGRELKKLDSSGVAQSTGIGLSYPFIRSRAFSVWGVADYSHKAMHDSSVKVITSQKQINSGKLGFNGQYLDSFFGGGMNQFSVDTTLGNVDLLLPAELAGDVTTAQTQGIFNKHNFSVTRLQKITDTLSLFATANGQLAEGNLSSAEKFILGGSSAVRAYPTGEASGDSGYVANFELRYDVPYKTDIGTLQLVGFFDTGYIVQHTHRWKNDVTNKTGLNDYSLHGSGIGVNFAHANHFSIRGTWAHTIGDNAGISTAGNDSSGQHDENRFLLNTLVSF